MDLSNVTYECLDQHVIEELVFGTGELSSVLKGHLFIEKILESIISQNIPYPELLFGKHKLSFELKVDLARAMGLLSDKFCSAFKALNNIRNNYAHKPSFMVTFEQLTGLKFDWEPIQEKAYKAACKKGVEDATLLAIIFLCWKSIYLIKTHES